MRVTLTGVLVGVALYWAVQHFTGFGKTGKPAGQVRAGLIAAWLAGMGLVSWRMVHRDHHMPVPGALLGVSGLFAAMALVSDIWPRSTGIVTLTAVGLDVAAFFDALPAGLSGQITAAQQSTAKAEGVQVAQVARIFALGTLVVGGLIIADLWAHPTVTNKVISFGTTESRLLAGKQAGMGIQWGQVLTIGLGVTAGLLIAGLLARVLA